MPKVSVIIPVYKVGKYIENSMKSVIAQTYKDFEVVIVDNNTPDDSIEIAEKVLTSTEIDYRVVKQTKQGLPAARNMGIAAAKGEWCVSIDPDDTISKYFLEMLYTTSQNRKVNLVFSKYDEVGPDRLFDFPQEQNENCEEEYTKEEMLPKLLVRTMPLMVSNMFFNKAFFESLDLQFPEDVILGADLICLWEILIKTDKIVFLNKCLYNHFDRPDSLMTAPSMNKIDSNLAGYAKLYNYIKNNENEQLASWVFAREVFAFLSTISLFGDKKLLKEYSSKYYSKETYHALSLFPDKKVQLLNKIQHFSPSLFFTINKLIRGQHSPLGRLLTKKVHK